MNAIRYIIFLIIYTFIVANINAQLPDEPEMILSPTASQFQRYGDVPVSPYTGKPSINIPLYDIKVSNFSFPIHLSYDGSGVIPDKIYGALGINWNLMAGGVITRIQKDFIDEYDFSQKHKELKDKGFFYRYSKLNRFDWNNDKFHKEVARSIAKSDTIDTEPDEFFFNFLDYSGKFLMGVDGNWKVQSNNNIKIIPNKNLIDNPLGNVGIKRDAFDATLNHPKCFSGFTLIDETGIQYVFGGESSAIEYSMPLLTQHLHHWVATSWYLTKIILTNGVEIQLKYKHNGFSCQLATSIDISLKFKVTDNGFINLNPKYETGAYKNKNEITGFLTYPTYLDEIIFPHGYIKFSYQSSYPQLKYNTSIFDKLHNDWQDETLITGQDGIPYYWYPFLPYLQDPTYDYVSKSKIYENNYPKMLDKIKNPVLLFVQFMENGRIHDTYQLFYYGDSNTRVALKEIRRQKGAKVERYKFDYNNLSLLPPYLAKNNDHWGYYNGRTANSITYMNGKAVNYDKYISEYYATREPAENNNLMSYGSLEKITYPTGGYTKFEFEPHYYRKQLKEIRWDKNIINYGNDKKAGGLRIKKIINSHTGKEEDEIVTKEYFYSSNYLKNRKTGENLISSGVLGGQIKYHFENYTAPIDNGDNGHRVILSRFSSQGVLPSTSSSSGSHITYTNVIEKNADDSFTQFVYSNFDNGYTDESADNYIQESRTAYEPYNSREVERGLLLSSSMYNSGGYLVKKDTIIYEKDANENNYVRLLNVRANPIDGTHGYLEGTAYKIYTYKMRPQKSISIHYDPILNTPMQIEEKSLDYNAFKLLRAETVKGSGGKTIETSYQYSGDVLFKCEEKKYEDEDEDEIYRQFYEDFKSCCYDCDRDPVDGDIDSRCLSECEKAYTEDVNKYLRQKEEYLRQKEEYKNTCERECKLNCVIKK